MSKARSAGVLYAGIVSECTGGPPRDCIGAGRVIGALRDPRRSRTFGESAGRTRAAAQGPDRDTGQRMPTITVDGRSLSIDGRRLWIVSGTVGYHRTPAALWAARITAARQAGLNCIETPVVWALHEPRPGVFKFDADLDLVAFIKLVAVAQMHCILRLGPYVGEGISLGGLPAWLLKDAGSQLRTGAPEFLQPVSRYFAEVCERVQGLQASLSRKSAGPIIAVQNENRWLCGSGEQARAYLGETNRYLRENGINVPVLAANELFSCAEGEIETWSGASHLHAHMRQLRSLNPDQPRIVSGLTSCAFGSWGLTRAQEPDDSPRALTLATTQALAAGAQFNLSPFHAGTNFAFTGGRLHDGTFASTDAAPGAPLREAGDQGDAYLALRRVCTFASQFGRVLAALDPEYQPAVLSLDPPAAAGSGRAGSTPPATISAVECRGSQGSVVFVFCNARNEERRHASVVLADGSTLPLELEHAPVAWLLSGVHLVDRATLDYCNLNAFAMVGRVFVCFGPGGMFGVYSINGSAFNVVVPTNDEPNISTHEGITIVVCNERSIDAVWLGPSCVFIGASGVDAAGRPMPHPDYKKITRISGTGESTPVQAPAASARKAKAAIGPWSVCGTDSLVSGKSERYASIEAPATLESLGAPSGYAWMRLAFKGMSRSAKAGFFEAADRLHLYFDSEFHRLVGAGPGAEGPVVPLPFKKGEHTLTMLIDNLGRWADGDLLGENKGLFGHVVEVDTFRAGTPKVVSARSIEPLQHWPVVMGLEDGDATDPRRVTWRIQHRKKTSLIMRVGGLRDPAMLLVNGQPIRMLPRGVVVTAILTPEMLSRGTSEVQVAVVGDIESALRELKGTAEFYEAASILSARAGWAFAKWEPPSSSKFTPIGKKGASEWKGRPAWWRASLSIDSTDAPLYLEARGLTKGQLLLNGHNLGRYFVATRTGKSVPGQDRYYLPEPWLKVGANELMIFDEHGFSPEQCVVRP